MVKTSEIALAVGATVAAGLLVYYLTQSGQSQQGGAGGGLPSISPVTINLPGFPSSTSPGFPSTLPGGTGPLEGIGVPVSPSSDPLGFIKKILAIEPHPPAIGPPATITGYGGTQLPSNYLDNEAYAAAGGYANPAINRYVQRH